MGSEILMYDEHILEEAPSCILNMDDSYKNEEIIGNKVWCNQPECKKTSRYNDKSSPIYQTTKYLNKSQREQYKIIIKDGKLYKNDKTLLTTEEPHGYGWIFIFTLDNILYAGPHLSDPGLQQRFHHSSFISGDPVATAGYLICNNGIISSIKWVSGHYKPTSGTICMLLKYLYNNDVDIKDITLLNRSDEVIPYLTMCSTGECGEFNTNKEM